MASRSLYDLRPVVRDKMIEFIERYRARGFDLLITCTYRSAAEQDALYALGRTKPGKRVTNAKGGNSYHQYGVAVDIVPLMDGKPLWQTHDRKNKLLPAWQAVCEVAAELGIEWAGNWKSFKEYAHLQYTSGLTLADFKAGA